VNYSEELMSARDLAEYAKLPYKHLWTYQKRGILPMPDFHLGKSPVWKKSSVLAWDTARKSKDEVIVVQQ
jgi:predicted DNA-binding transcriptional regulator AlpA